MANYMRNGEDARVWSLLVQLIAWPFFFRVMLLAKQHWQEVSSYQALSDHPSLPLDVQESQHMMMIALIVFVSWGLPSYFAKCSLRRNLWCFLAVVDLALVGFITTALVDRAQHFPTTFPRCARSNDSEPIGKLFAYLALVANESNENGGYSPDSVCQDFLGEWVYTIILGYSSMIPSILGCLNLSENVTKIVLVLFFFPVALACGMVFLGSVAAYSLYKLAAYILYQSFSRLYPYVSPPIKWSLWHLSWPLRIVWSALVGIVPSIRYMARARRKRVLTEKSCSGSLDLEKGRHTSSSGSVIHMVETHRTWIEPLPNYSNLSQASNSKSQQPTQAGDTGPSNKSLSKVALKPRICRHSKDWHCWACGVQACSQCSVETSGLPQTTQHFFCEPRCSRCYLNTMCGILPAKKSKPCSHRQDRCKTLQTPRVCRSCSENCSADELLGRLEEREREELLHLARHNLKCGVCEQRLQPKGPRWWTCCDCNEECNSDCHPSWSKIPEYI